MAAPCGLQRVFQRKEKPERLLFEAHPSPTRHERRSEHLPITVAQVAFLGDVRSENTYVVCDLGFAGQIDAYVLLSYGDTLYTDSNYSATPFRGMVSDSIALATHDPLKVLDVNLNDDGYPTQFCPIMTDMGEDPTECALGITNVVETYPGQGIIYYLLNHRPNGTNNLLGAGVATITLDTTVYPPLPNIQRANQSQYLWDGSCEPWFGDVGAIRYNDYIYAYGHAQDIAWVYLARVPWQDATDVTCYEYWNGDGWQSERLNYGVGEKESVFWAVNQGQVVWNDYYGCFLFVYCDTWLNNKILLRSAPAPEGPWSDPPLTLYTATPITPGSSIYAAAPQVQYDPLGRTLVVCFTNDPNCVQCVRVTFA